MSQKTNIYQIHIRQYLNFHNVKKLISLDLQLFRKIKENGFDTVWLMGIWQLPDINIIKKYAANANQIAYYKTVLPDFTEDDICGSTFAIDEYKIDASICQCEDEFKIFKQALNGIGLKVMLDFIPNHFHIESKIVKENPNYFISWDQSFENLTKTYSSSLLLHENKEIHIANGKDPNYDAWFDTAQINWFNPDLIKFMQSNLNYVATLADAVRCDMAMLQICEIYKSTWSEYAKTFNLKIEKEVWPILINSVKSNYPNFVFLAECYWDKEETLIDFGFNYAYLKDWLDFIATKPDLNSLINFVDRINNSISSMGVVFIENHDEKRAKELFPSDTEYLIYKNITKNVYFSYLENWGQEERFRYRAPIQLKRLNKST